MSMSDFQCPACGSQNFSLTRKLLIETVEEHRDGVCIDHEEYEIDDDIDREAECTCYECDHTWVVTIRSN